MKQRRRHTLTEAGFAGLFFTQRYRFLTIDQFARASGLARTSASRLFTKHALPGKRTENM
jgi:hypothetical protein